MNRPAALFFAVVILLAATHRLPAPIQEIPESPTLIQKHSPEPKLVRSRQASDSSSDPVRRFDGAWSGSRTTNGAHHTDVVQNLLKIRGGDRTASITSTVTQTLVPGQVWGNVPEAYQTTSPIVLKYVYSSNDLRVDGSNLRIRWPAVPLADWSPKTIPAAVIQPIATGRASMSVYTLHGNELTREFDSNGGVTYKRAK